MYLRWKSCRSCKDERQIWRTFKTSKWRSKNLDWKIL